MNELTHQYQISLKVVLFPIGVVIMPGDSALASLHQLSL